MKKSRKNTPDELSEKRSTSSGDQKPVTNEKKSLDEAYGENDSLKKEKEPKKPDNKTKYRSE